MKEFKIRASAAGNIMGVKALGKTGETYCKDWLKGQIYNRVREIDTKYTRKGNECEDSSIDFVAEQLGYGFLIKNEQYFENDFMQGTPDVILPDCIIDVKNSWDTHTFPLLETEVPNQDYFYQAQVYMELTGRVNYRLIYVLSDTPEHMIESEARRYCWNNGFEELDMDIYEKFKAKMTYSDVPEQYKIKVFEIKRDLAVIKKLVQRVIECREVVKELVKAVPDCV
jgi:hypothetical protein